MNEIPIKRHVRYLFGIAIIVFILNKLYLRSWILKNDLPGIFQVLTYAIPNLIEAIIGTLLLTGILLQTRQFFNQKAGYVKDVHIHVIAVSIAAVYVIAQELKFHNLGGNNVYDPYDLIASVVGLLGTFFIIRKFGFINKAG